jgi:hypothetical protein
MHRRGSECGGASRVVPDIAAAGKNRRIDIASNALIIIR